MKNVRKIDLFFMLSLVLIICSVGACKKDDDDDMMDDDMMNDTMVVDNDTMMTDTTDMDTTDMGNPNATVWVFSEDSYTQDALQTALTEMDDEDTIHFEAGTYEVTTQLSSLDKSNVTIMGAGIDETILDFTNQIEVAGAGAEGLKVTGGENIIIANLTIQNTIGDALKAKDCSHIAFYNVGTVWTGEASEDNGAYGLYPVNCEHVLIDGCVAIGASDAGIYVGQTTYVIVRNSFAEFNVAGIEIENTKYADVYGNIATHNTGGILIFDLPGLSQNGEQCRIFNNTIVENNYRNFAPEGNIVADVPSGTGIMIMASKDVEVFDNEITNNNVMGLGFVDYEVLTYFSDITLDDPNYITNPRGVYVHANTFSRTNECPEEQNAIGNVLTNMFPGCEMPDMLYDGTTAQADLADGEKLCIDNNGDASMANLFLQDFPFSTPELNPEEFFCVGTSLPEVTVEVPELP